MEHPLQLDHVAALDLREGPVTQAPLGRPIDPAQLGDRVLVLADIDRDAQVVAAAAGIVRIRDAQRRRLEEAPAAVAAFRAALAE